MLERLDWPITDYTRCTLKRCTGLRASSSASATDDDAAPRSFRGVRDASSVIRPEAALPPREQENAGGIEEALEIFLRTGIFFLIQ